MVNIYNDYFPEYVRKATICIREKAPYSIKKIATVFGDFIEILFKHRYWHKKANVVIAYYKNKALTEEEKKAILFLKKNRFFLDANRFMYLSNNVNKYKRKLKKTAVLYDPEKKLHFLTHENKRLYFPRMMPEKQILSTYYQFMSEMDNDSPHLYTSNINELKNKVLFDCGVAEGLFPLTFIDYFKKIVLFECDNDWVEALKATFAPYCDKVTIIQKYVSNKDSISTITLDYFSKTNNIFLILLKLTLRVLRKKRLVEQIAF